MQCNIDWISIYPEALMSLTYVENWYLLMSYPFHLIIAKVIQYCGDFTECQKSDNSQFPNAVASPLT